MIFSHNQGFTLIEVLISLILLSFIVLGFDAMELYALRSMRAAYYFNVATHQLVSMSERLRVFNQSDDISKQVVIWNVQNKELLPAGEGSVIGHYPDYTLTLYWGGFANPCRPIHVGLSGCVQQRIQI